MGERIKVGNYEFLPSKYIEMLFENGAADSISAIALTAPQNAPVTSYLPYYIKSTQTAVIDDNMGIITFPISDVSGYSKAQLFIDGNPIDISPENIAVGKDHITVYNEHGDSVTGILLYDLQFVNDYLIDSAKQLGQLGDILISLYGNDRNKLAKKVKLISKLLTRHRKAEALLGIINIILDLPVAPVDGKILRMSDNLEIVYYDAGEYIVIDKGNYSVPLTNHIDAQNGMTVKLGQPLTNLVELQQRFGELRLFIDPSVARLDYSLSSSFEEILGAYRSYSSRGNDFRIPKPLDEKPNSSDFQGAFYLNKYALTRLTSPIGFAFSYRFVQSRISKNVYNLDLDKPYSSAKLSAPILAQKNQYVTSRLTGSVYNPLRQNAYAIGKLQGTVQFNAYKFVRAKIKYTVGDKALENRYISTVLSVPVDVQKPRRYVKSSLSYTVYNKTREQLYVKSKIKADIQFNSYKFIRAYMEYTVQNTDLENKFVCADIEAPIDASMLLYIYSRVKNYAYNLDRSKAYTRAVIQMNLKNMDAYTFAKLQTDTKATKPKYIYTALIGDVLNGSLSDRFSATYLKEDIVILTRYYATASIVADTSTHVPERYAMSQIRDDLLTSYVPFWYEYDEKENPVALWVRVPDEYVEPESTASTFKLGATNVKSKLIKYDDPKKVFDFFTDFESLNEIKKFAERKGAYITYGTFSTNVSFPSIGTQVNKLEPYDINFDEETLHALVDASSPFQRRLQVTNLSEEEAIPTKPSMVLHLESTDVKTDQVSIDTNITIKDGGLLNPLKISDIENTQSARILFQSLTTTISGQMRFYFKARAGTTWNFSIISLSTYNASVTATGDWQRVYIGICSFNENFILKISNTTVTQTKETIWLGAFNLTSPACTIFHDYALQLMLPSIAPLANTYDEFFTGKLAKPIPTMDSGTIILRMNPFSCYPSSVSSKSVFELSDKTNTRRLVIDEAYGGPLQYALRFYYPGGSVIPPYVYTPNGFFAISWQYDPVIQVTEISCYTETTKYSVAISGKISFLEGLEKYSIWYNTYSTGYVATQLAEIFVYDRYMSSAELSLICTQGISVVNDEPIYRPSLLYVQSGGYLSLPLGFNAEEGAIGTAKMYNPFPELKYEKLFCPGLTSQASNTDNATFESYIYPGGNKALIAYGGMPTNISFSCDLVYFSTYTLPANKFVNSYFELLPVNSGDSKYEYRAFLWNSDLLKTFKMYDISPTFTEANELVINEDLSVGTFDGLIESYVNELYLSNLVSLNISSFTQVPTEPCWDFSGVQSASIVSGALRLTPTSDAYYTNPTYFKGLAFDFPIGDGNFIIQTLIGFPGGYPPIGRVGIMLMDENNNQVAFGGIYDAQAYDYPQKNASIRDSSWSTTYTNISQVKIKIERVNQYGNIYIDDQIVLRDIYFPDNISKILFVNLKSPSYAGYSYMDIKNLYIDGFISEPAIKQGSRTSPEYMLQLSGAPISALISWHEEITPPYSAVEVYTNLFNGVEWLGWKQCTSGGPIPDCDLDSIDWPNARLQTKQILTVSVNNISSTVSISNLSLVFNTEKPNQVNQFIKSLRHMFIGWPEGTSPVYVDYVGIAKADPVTTEFKFVDRTVYIKIDGNLHKQRAIRIPYQYIRELDAGDIMFGYSSPEEWEGLV